MNLFDLPIELLYRIIANLSFKIDRFNGSLVCKKFNEVLSDEILQDTINARFAFELSEFFKHCMNVGAVMRNEEIGYQTPLWSGWIRIQITPYLTNGKLDYYIEKPNTPYWLYHDNDAWIFKNCLTYTLQDYIEYHAMQGESMDRAENLLKLVHDHTNNELIAIIEKNYTLFPTEKDYNSSDIISEEWHAGDSTFKSYVVSKFEQMKYMCDGLIRIEERLSKFKDNYVELQAKFEQSNDWNYKLNIMREMEKEQLLCYRYIYPPSDDE